MGEMKLADANGKSRWLHTTENWPGNPLTLANIAAGGVKAATAAPITGPIRSQTACTWLRPPRKKGIMGQRKVRGSAAEGAELEPELRIHNRFQRRWS